MAKEVEREKEILTTKLEITTRHAMEKVSCAFLKEQADKSNTQVILEITAKLEAKLFYKEEQKPEIQPGRVAPSAFLTLDIGPHKLAFPTYDGKEDPIPWLNRCEQFFKGQRTPKSEKIWYASYHLTGTAQQCYMRLPQDNNVIDWAYFTRCVNERFRPSIRCNTLGKNASLRKMGTIDNYMECFLAHMACTDSFDEQQQVNIYTPRLLEPLKTDVELLNPQDMETAMSLARAYERHLAVIAEANKEPALKPRRLPPPNATMTTTTTTMPTTMTMGATAPTSHPFKCLTTEEMAERCHAGLCFNCDEPFARGTSASCSSTSPLSMTTTWRRLTATS
jgi:hypothetical protein